MRHVWSRCNYLADCNHKQKIIHQILFSAFQLPAPGIAHTKTYIILYIQRFNHNGNKSAALVHPVTEKRSLITSLLTPVIPKAKVIDALLNKN